MRFRAEMKMFQLNSGIVKTLFSPPPFFSGFCSGATAKHLSRRAHEAQQCLIVKTYLAHQRLAPWPRAPCSGDLGRCRLALALPPSNARLVEVSSAGFGALTSLLL